MNTRKIVIVGIGAMAFPLLFSSCKKQKESDDIIVEKIVEKPQNGAISMSVKNDEGTVKWVNNAIYSYSLVRSVDAELPEVENNGETYKDNCVQLTVKRSDGTEFYSSTFAKSSFTGLLSNEMKQHGVFLGLSYDHCDENNLYFVASIGSPDESNEDFTLVLLILNRMGTTSVANYNPEDVPSTSE